MSSSNSDFSSFNLKQKIKLFFTGRTFSFGIGYVCFLGGRLLRDLLLARFLGAGAFGSWAALNILRQYGNYSDVGLFNGLARELPKLTEKQHEASEMAGNAVIGTFVGTFLVLLWVLLIEPEGFSTDTLGWFSVLMMILFICIEKFYKYFNALFLGMDQVKSAGLWLACLSLLDLILAAVGAYIAGIRGLLVGTVAAIAITSLAMGYYRPLKLRLTFSFAKFKHLLLSSLLLMCFGLLNIALHNFDRTLFLFINGPNEVLGSYHAASLMALSVSILPFIITSVVNPRIYGLSPDSDTEFNILLGSSGLLACILASAGGVFAYAISYFILTHFFPLQVQAPLIAPYLILGEVFFAAAMIPDSILLVKGKGTKVLILKAALMLVLMGLAVAYLYHKPEPSPELLALKLAKIMSVAQIGCFLISFVICIFSMKLNKLNLRLLAWPTILTTTAAIIIFLSEYKVLWKN